MSKLTIGLALSGGTAKSVAHVGVLKALAEEGVRIDYVSGTSGGSIVASMFASGMPLASMESVATTMSWRKLASIKLSRLGFISSERIERFVEELIGDVQFEDLRVPCAVIAADLVTGEKRVFRTGPVARAVRASCSIPQIYLPVEIDGRYYVDGGLAEYLPIESVRALGCGFAIGSHLAPVEPRYHRPRHILQLVIQITGLMARKNYLRSEVEADFVIHPNLDAFGSFDFDNADRMIEVAYLATKEAVAGLKWRIAGVGGLWARVVRRLRGE